MPTELSLPADFATCPHDRGPGIAVCLRCRAEGNRKVAAARRRFLTRVAIGGMVTLVVLAASGTGLASRFEQRAHAPAAGAAPTESFQVAMAGAAEPSSDPARDSARDATALLPLVAPGRSALMGGMYAERTGDSVTVHFDTPMLRTRRRDKFEQVVRATLPAVYGAAADSALAAVPEGELAPTDLMAEPRVVTLPARDGWALTLHPATRPGQDGPLVVAYRVSVARAH